MSGGLVAVAFSDVVASTELWSSLGDERADDLRRRLRLATDEAVVSVAGTVVKDLGDGVMATFSTASASIDGAVAMQQAADALARASGVSALKIRVGVSIGEANQEGDDWFGVPVVEAARLCSDANGGQILVADSVLMLARRTAHSTRALGARVLKGLAESITVSEVEWLPRDLTVALPGFLRGHAGDLPFTGRDAALDQLRATYEHARVQHLAVVSGEPGVGKTRLVAEFATECVQHGALVLAVAYEEGADVYHRTLPRALRALQERCEPPDSARDVLGALGVGGGATHRTDVDPATIGDALGEWIALASRQQPVVIVADDLHWASSETLSVLRSIVAAVDDAPVLLIGTYRDTDLDRAHPLAAWLADRRRDDPPVRVDLHGLDLYDTVAVLAARAGQALDGELLRLAEELYRETEGNAFFLGQMIDHLFESGALTASIDGWKLLVPVDHLGLPQGVREVVGRRLDRLPRRADDVLAAAAVQGREFSVAIVRAAVELDLDVVVDVLDAVEAAGLIRPEPTSRGQMTFVHALVRETVLEELSSLRRSRVHLHVARALDAAQPTPTRAAALEMVGHYLEAAALGGLDRAVELLPQVFVLDANVLILDVNEIHRAVGRLLEAAQEVGLDDRHFARLYTYLAMTAYYVDNDRPTCESAFKEAVRFAQRVGDPELFAEAVGAGQNASGFGLHPEFLTLAPGALAGVDPLSEVAASLRLAIVTAHSLFAPPGVDPATEYMELLRDFPRAFPGMGMLALHARADVSQSMAEASRPPAQPPDVFRAWSLARVDLAVAATSLDDVAPIVERAGSGVFVAGFWQCRALLAVAQGRFDEAAECIDRVEREAGGEPMFAAGVPWQRSRLASWRGEPAEALYWWAQSGPLSPYPRVAGLAHAQLQLSAGDAVSAEQGFRDGWADGPRSLSRDWTYTGALAEMAELAAQVGTPEQAAELDELLAPFDGQFMLETCISLLGSVSWLRGGLARRQGDLATARRHYERALAFETEQGAVPMAARTMADLARLGSQV